MVVFAMSQEAARPWKLRRVDAVAVSQEAARHVPGGGSTAVADTVSDSVAAPWRDAAAAAAAARAHAVDNAPKSEDIEAVMKLERELSLANRRLQDLHNALEHVISRAERDKARAVGMDYRAIEVDIRIRSYNVCTCFPAVMKTLAAILGPPENYHPAFDSDANAEEKERPRVVVDVEDSYLI